MSANEFNQLYDHAIAQLCRCRIRLLGCRMNFQSAVTDSKWATLEFVTTEEYAVGINNEPLDAKRCQVFHSTDSNYTGIGNYIRKITTFNAFVLQINQYWISYVPKSKYDAFDKNLWYQDRRA